MATWVSHVHGGERRLLGRVGPNVWPILGHPRWCCGTGPRVQLSYEFKYEAGDHCPPAPPPLFFTTIFIYHAFGDFLSLGHIFGATCFRVLKELQSS